MKREEKSGVRSQNLTIQKINLFNLFQSLQSFSIPSILTGKAEKNPCCLFSCAFVLQISPYIL